VTFIYKTNIPTIRELKIEY